MTAVDIEALSVPDLERLRDACNQRLLELRASGVRSLPELLKALEDVKLTLRDQGKEWRSLERWQWMDGQIRFWLNPIDQDNYRSGWYTVDELIAWTRNLGPVLSELDEEDEDDEEMTTVDGVRIRWLPDGSMQRESSH